MGIEFAYAAETAFVSPTLLKIGKSNADEVPFIFKLKPLLRRPPRAHDSHMVPVSADWFLSNPNLGLAIRQMPFKLGTSPAFHSSLVRWGGHWPSFSAQWQTHRQAIG